MLTTFARKKFRLQLIRKDKYMNSMNQQNNSLLCIAIFYAPEKHATSALGRDTRCDKSLRHIAATSRLVYTSAATGLFALILSLRSVAQIQTSLNLCDRSQRQHFVATTMIFTCHTRPFVAATCRCDVSQRFVA